MTTTEEPKDPVSFCDQCHQLTRVRKTAVNGRREILCERCRAEVTR